MFWFKFAPNSVRTRELSTRFDLSMRKCHNFIVLPQI